MEIHIPPLRERPEDIPELIEHFIKRHNPELKRNFQGIDEAAVRVLMALQWKGNVRELDNVIEHTMILAEGDRIMLKNLPSAIIASSQTNPGFTFNLRDALRQFEKQHILRALDQAHQDRREAARLLDISLSSLYRKIEELEIS
jgi:transcriptional regulator with PAS, ATPase and Fis domain